MDKIAAENPIPMYWVRPQQILSAEVGFHRFVWDLHYAPPDSLTHEFPISAIYRNTPELPLGAIALPGRYMVKFTVDGKSYDPAAHAAYGSPDQNAGSRIARAI